MKNVLIYISIIFLTACSPDTDLVEQVIEQPDVPTQVTLLFPENNSECTTGIPVSETESEVTFNWSEAQVSDGYVITLTNLANGESRTFESDSNSMPIRVLLSTPYSWKVTSFLNNSGDRTESNTEVFYNSGPGLEFFVPFPAGSPNPNQNANLATTSTVNFSWSANDLDNDIIGFDFYFGNTADPELFALDLVNPNISNVEVNSGNAYYWRVVTKDAIGNESTSETFSFSVQ